MRDSDKYRERDERIKRLLLSSDEAERHKGVDELHKTFRNQVASVLLSRARRRDSLAFDPLLDHSSWIVHPEVFDEIWQETLICVHVNVQRERFEEKGSLLSYLLEIAGRRLVDWTRKRWRLERNVDRSEIVEQLPCTPEAPMCGLYDDIEKFFDDLSNKDQVILRAGVILVLANGLQRVRAMEVVAKIKRIFREEGWKEMTAAAIVRRYYRLRDRLREYLRKRGYDV